MGKTIKLPIETKIKVLNKQYQLTLFDIKIKREINTLLLPLFAIWRGGKERWRIWKLVYKIEYWNRKWSLEIRGDSELWVPWEFDYNIFNAILSIYEIQREEYVEFTTYDIINILWLKKNGQYYKLIDESISRLTSTNYKFLNSFIKKHNLWNIKNNTEDKLEFHILDSIHAKSLDDENYIKKTKYTEKYKRYIYRVRLWREIISNIEKKYFKYYEAYKLLWKNPWWMKRMGEIIEFQRNWKLIHEFYYSTLSDMIPLESWRMNRVYINKYAEKLKEVWYIKDYECWTQKIKVYFNEEVKKKDNENQKGYKAEHNKIMEWKKIDKENSDLYNKIKKYLSLDDEIVDNILKDNEDTKIKLALDSTLRKESRGDIKESKEWYFLYLLNIKNYWEKELKVEELKKKRKLEEERENMEIEEDRMRRVKEKKEIEEYINNNTELYNNFLVKARENILEEKGEIAINGKFLESLIRIKATELILEEIKK